MLEKFLQDVGFSEKEVQIYLSLLSVDNATVTELAKMTKINRTTLYPVIENLVNKNMVLEIEKGKKARFQAEPPERLATYIQNEKSRLEEKEKLLDEIIPRLKSVSLQTGEKPIVKVYEGREGILKSVQEYFEINDKIDNISYLIYPKDKLAQFFSEKERNNARKLRIDKKINSISIYTSKENAVVSDEFSTRYKIDQDKYNISCEIGIYSDSVRINVLGKEMAAIYIKSRDVSDTLKSIFKLAIKGINSDDKKLN